MILLASAWAGTCEDTFDAASSCWTGGTVAEGVLTVEDESSVSLGEATSLTGTLRLRVPTEGHARLTLGDATWELDYVDGAVHLGEEAIPLPTGHYRWEPDAEPTIEPSDEVWDAGNTLHADVIQDPATSLYFLFWTGEMPAPNYPYRQIGLATSPDGVTWTRYAGNPVLTIDYDRTTVDGIHVHMPTVVIDGSDWHMYYSCYQNDVGNRICHATSPDGYTWTPQGVVLDQGGAGEFDEGSLRMPDVLIGPDGTWHMLYNGTDPEEHYGPTGYATSPDGWTWTKQGAITADKSSLQGGGMVDGPYGIEQWWNCDDIFCHSTAQWGDLTDWVDHGVALEKAWADWSFGYIQAPTPILIGTTWHMWFNAYDYATTDPHERIGHARTVPVPGEWLDVSVAWDGATLTVTQSGASQAVSLAAADSLQLTTEGGVELDAASLSWTEAVDTGGDTAVNGETGDSAPTGDSAEPTDSDPEHEKEPEGCGCETSGMPGVWALGLAMLGLRRR